MEGSQDEQASVLIIGAGIAGISAGECLARHGHTNFKIIEASDRVGGRIWSVDAGDEKCVELGAHWIHGIERNPIYKIAEENNLLKLRNAERTLHKRDIFVTEDGEVVNEKTVKEVDFAYGLLIQQCEDYFRKDQPTPEDQDSVGAHLEREFYGKIRSTNNGNKDLKRLIFNQRICLECCITGCDNMHEVSLGEFGCYEELPGIHYTIPPGFGTLLDIVKEKIPAENISLNKTVRCIYWGERNSKGEICVECENGEKFYANHVIVTVSLGVLKAACDRMFCPPLPQDKHHAIETIGFGLVDKVILVFDQQVVDNDVFRIELLWDNQSNKGQDLKYNWVRKIYSFEVVHENILVGWLSGTEALYMESLSEEEIGNACVGVLKMFLKKDDIPAPIRVIRTRWGHNQLTRGSYSFVKVGCTQSDFYALGLPLIPDGDDKPAVLFAGEATHPTFYSTTHGALLTGQREARRILEMYMDGDMLEHSESEVEPVERDANGSVTVTFANPDSDSDEDDL